MNKTLIGGVRISKVEESTGKGLKPEKKAQAEARNQDCVLAV